MILIPASLYLLSPTKKEMPSDDNTEKTTRQIVNELYPVVDDAKLRSRVNGAVCDFVTYDATSVSALQHFQPIQENTECIFAKRAVLWGNRDWDTAIGLGTLVVRSAFCCVFPS